MKRSTERILTTHAGRLPNPDNIAAIQKARADGDQATFERLMQAGVADRVRKQRELRNDIHSDGEFWKARDELYYKSRVTGVEMQLLKPGEGASILVHQQERHMPEFQRVLCHLRPDGQHPTTRRCQPAAHAQGGDHRIHAVQRPGRHQA